MNKKRNIYVSIIGIAIFLALLGVTYAWFNSNITGEGSDIVVKTGTLSIEYISGPEITVNNFYPGDTVEKTFTVKNTGDDSAIYDIGISDYLNTFINNEFVYTLEEETKGRLVNKKPLSQNMRKGISIDKGEIHNYNLTLKFLETDVDQGSNQGAKFSGVIKINESNAIVEYTDNLAIVYEGLTTNTEEEKVLNTFNFTIENINNDAFYYLEIPEALFNEVNGSSYSILKNGVEILTDKELQDNRILDRIEISENTSDTYTLIIKTEEELTNKLM